MLRRIAAGAGSFGLLAAATAAQAQTTGKEIFTPVQNDLALINLRKLLGCVVDGVLTAATCSDDRPLTVALGYFNVGCLIVRNGRVVGRGWTQKGGRPHAEAQALEQAMDRARGATAGHGMASVQSFLRYAGGL